MIALALRWTAPCPRCAAPVSGEGVGGRCACGAAVTPALPGWLRDEALGLLRPGERSRAPGVEAVREDQPAPPDAARRPDGGLTWGRWLAWPADGWDTLSAQLTWVEPDGTPLAEHPAARELMTRARLGMATSGALQALRTGPVPALEDRLDRLHPRLLEALVDNPGTPPGWLAAIGRRHAAVADQALLRRRDLPDDVRRLLLDAPEPTIRLAALTAEQDPAVLARITGHSDVWLRMALADRPSLPDALWRALARDPDPRVRARVAGNTAAAPKEIRERAAARADPAWRPRWWDRWLDR